VSCAQYVPQKGRIGGSPRLSEPVTHVSDLTRRFGAKTALASVSVSVSRGAVHGLVGANGAGKTTLIEHVLGLLRAESGAVRVFGLDPVAEPVAVLSRIGYLSEEDDLPGPDALTRCSHLTGPERVSLLRAVRSPERRRRWPSSSLRMNRTNRRQGCDRSASGMRVSVAIQLTSHVLPPSSEKDCSKWHEFAVMSEITKRTRMARPFRGSWSKNSPRPFLNSPIVGWLTVPARLFEKFRLHWCDSGL
jgi:hypothetical protein